MLVTHSLQCSIINFSLRYLTLRRLRLSVFYIKDDKLDAEKVALPFKSLESSHCKSVDQV
jgi:hypothetical protein